MSAAPARHASFPDSLAVNYFNYFTEIEQHFQRKRGALVYLSPVDWALIESWRAAEIPLEAVLAGMDQAFEKFASGRRKDARPRALIYCAPAVAAAAEAMQAAAVGGHDGVEAATPAGFESERVQKFLRDGQARVLEAELPAVLQPLREEISGALAQLAGETWGAERSLEELERVLTVLDDRLSGALLMATPTDIQVGVRASLDRELAAYRRKLRPEQLALIERRFLQQRLLEHYRLPRLSLFYMG